MTAYGVSTDRDLNVPRRDLAARVLAVALLLLELPVLAGLALGALVTRVIAQLRGAA